MKAFIAINLTNELVRCLTSARDELRLIHKSANYSRQENLHLTLAFIGETSRTDDIIRIMKSCACKPFEITLHGCGSFGNNIFWAGIEKCHPLEKLAAELRASLSENGFAIDPRPFSPHITLAREMRGADSASVNIPYAKMTVCSFSLMESTKENGLTVYKEIKTVHLK